MSHARAHDDDFSGLYHIPRITSPADLASAERKLEKATLATLTTRASRPSRLKYFEKVVLSAGNPAGGAHAVGIFCNFVPEELVEAAGAVPVRLCTGSVVAESVAEQVLPRDLCPLARASFGAIASGLGAAARVRALVLPIACDAKRRLGEILQDYLPVIPLSIPARSDHRTELNYWASELERLAGRLSEITGVKVTRLRLKDAILRRRAREDAFRVLEHARVEHQHVLSGSDLALVTAASFTDDPVSWARAACELAAEVREIGASQPRPNGFIPLVLTGAPVLWPAWKIYEVMESAGATVVADTLCSVTQRLYDPVQVDDWSRSGMLRALALRSFSASLCPCFIDSTALVDRVIELVRRWQARGVVAHNLRLCQLFEVQCARLRYILRAEGIPFIALHTELGTEDVEQIRIRVEAFLEMLQEQRVT